MRKPSSDRAMTLGFVALSFAVAFWQRPGWATTDTKIDLHVDPVAFLGQVASVWTPTNDLGHVHGAQYAGYLWPMGPVFALLHSIGIGAWAAQRIWLGLLFALSAWGMLRLLDILVGRPRGVAHVVGAAFYVLNPYTTVFTARATITLLGYAALPWLLIVVHGGVRAVRDAAGRRDWRPWWWAAAFALILTSMGGGINGAVVGWVLVGPLVLLAYEPAIGTVRWRDSAGFLLRAGGLGLLASLWWIVPLVVHAGYGIDFLQFTEQPRSIWSTNSVPEALRLMAYWTSYVGVGYQGPPRSLFSESPTLLFNPFVVGASLLIPALAVLGFVWSRRWRYAPFLVLLLVTGVVIEIAGFPLGTPARDGMEWIYRNVLVLRFMRTTQKAAPLVACGVAGLLGIGAQLLWARLRTLERPAPRRLGMAATGLMLATLIALAALPLTRGTASDRQVRWKSIPAAWTDAGADLDRELPANSRAMVLPAQIFAFYNWGATVDPILPRTTEKPVVVRYETPYSDLHASDMLITVDGLVQQRRLFPGQLTPMLRLMGVRSVVAGSDDDISRSGALDPVAAAAELAGQGLDRPSRSYGPVRRLPQARGDAGPPVALPQVRRYDIPAGRGLVHVAPSGPATLVDGSAPGLAGLAAFGALPERAPILYAGDLSAAEMRSEAERGANVVITDSNRRREFVAPFSQQDVGRVLGENEPLNEDAGFTNPFPDLGPDAETVSVLSGVSYLSSPEQVGLLAFPEHAPIAAFDGDLSTSWVADRFSPPRDRWLQIGFSRPRDVPYVDLTPIRDSRGVETEVDVNGVRARIGPGRNRIRVDQKDVSSLRVRITGLEQPADGIKGSGGFREIRVPGLRPRQSLRPPVLTARALAGQDLSRVGLTWLFERTTGDQPFRRDRYAGSPLLELAQNRADAEKRIDRTVFAPEARTYDVDAWVQPAVEAPDSVLDRLAGWTGDEAFESSARFKNQPRYRASGAFDSRADSEWIGIWSRPAAPFPWISWRNAGTTSVSRLRLAPARESVRRPTVVRLSSESGTSPRLAVGAGGEVALPEPLRGRRFRLTVVASEFPPGATRRDRSARAVGLSAVEVPGLPRAEIPASGPLRTRCGDAALTAGGSTVTLLPRGTVAALDAGRPLRAERCGPRARMGKDVQHVRALPGPFSIDLLRMHSAAARPVPAAQGGGSVVEPGKLGHSSLTGAEVRLNGPSWLVLGQSYSRGWEATCDGRSLGKPQAIDGYANGWRAPADCRRVSFNFGPQGLARAGYAASGVVALLLLALLAAGALATRPGPARAVRDLLPDVRPRRLPLPRAAAIALAASVPLSLLFALRAGLVIFPVITLVLWRGVGARRLTAVAAGLFGVVVPLIYALEPPQNRGGYNSDYSNELIRAHWVGVLGLVLLALAGWRMVQSARLDPGLAQAGRSKKANTTARAE